MLPGGVCISSVHCLCFISRGNKQAVVDLLYFTTVYINSSTRGSVTHTVNKTTMNDFISSYS